jgi:Rhodanese-like domain
MFFQKYVVHAAIFFACLFTIGHGPGLAAADRYKVPEISVDQVKAMIGRPETVIIDVRRYRSWWRSRWKIATAVREDPSSVDKWAQKYAKDTTLVFYCS